MAHSKGFLRGLAFAAVILLGVSPALAQGPGGGGGGGGGGAGAGGGATGGGGGIGRGTGGGGLGGGMGAGGVGAGGTSSTLSTLGTGAVGGRGSGGSGGPAASNFLGSFFSYPVVTALPSTDTGSTSRNSSSTNAVSSTVTHTVPAYGSTSYTTTNTASRTGTTRGTATIRGNTRGTTPSTATVEGFNGGTTGDVLTRMPFYATSLRFKVAPPAVERVRAIVQDVIRGSSTVPSKDHITFDVAGKDVTLKGEVSSEDERRHVESLLRLTPGIGTISNQLTVKQ